MSLYALQKLLYELNRDPAGQEAFATDRETVLGRYRLTDEEADAMRRDDVGKLYILGVNGQILMHFAACGLMNAVGNLRPKPLAQLCEAVWRSDIPAARELHDRLLEINKAVFFDTNPIPIKYMMKRLGLIPENEHRLPMSPATPELEHRLDGVLERAGLLTAAAA